MKINIRSIDVFRLFDLPYELIEMIVEGMVIKEKLLKNLKFPKLWFYEPVTDSWDVPHGGLYRLSSGYHNYEIHITSNGRYVNIKKHYFMLK